MLHNLHVAILIKIPVCQIDVLMVGLVLLISNIYPQTYAVDNKVHSTNL